MQPHTRALIAASASAVMGGRKVTGIYDHAAGEHLRIAAECRGDRVMAADGERSVLFSGTLPELYDAGDRTYVSMEVEGLTARGFDRGSGTHYQAEVSDQLVQLYDHSSGVWFAFTVRDVEADLEENP